MSIGFSIGQPVKAPGDFEVRGDLTVDGTVIGANVAAPTGDVIASHGGLETATVGTLETSTLLVTDSGSAALLLGSLDVSGEAFLGAPGSAPTIPNNSQFSFYLDEANNKLKVKVKYSNGTVKTGEIALS